MLRDVLENSKSVKKNLTKSARNQADPGLDRSSEISIAGRKHENQISQRRSTEWCGFGAAWPKMGMAINRRSENNE
jgi:hypothetical protein